MTARPRPAWRRAALVTAVCAAAAGCGTAESGGGASTAPQEVTVFAAASLQGAFARIAAQHPELAVKFSYDGSSALVDALAQGAPADVLATADAATMARARSKELVEGEPQVVARNVLTLIVPAGNPGHVTGLDTSLTGRRLVVCAPQVPCGAASRTLAAHLGVLLAPVSEELKVTDVRGKVESGEADAGLVYATDARAAGTKVQVVPVPGAETVVNDYPIALVAHAPHGEAGRAFVAAVRSPEGQRELADAGFLVGR